MEYRTIDHVLATAHRSGHLDRIAGQLGVGILQSDRLVADALNWLAASAAVGLVAFAAKLPGVAGWAVSSFAATSVYLLGASVQLAAVKRFRYRAGGRTALTTSTETVS